MCFWCFFDALFIDNIAAKRALLVNHASPAAAAAAAAASGRCHRQACAGMCTRSDCSTLPSHTPRSQKKKEIKKCTFFFGGGAQKAIGGNLTLPYTGASVHGNTVAYVQITQKHYLIQP